MHPKTYPVTLSQKGLRWCAGTGIVASLTVMICNTLLYSFGAEVSVWPHWAINLSYWAGSMALALAAIGFVPTYVALRPSGRFWPFLVAGFLAYFVALGSAGHGSAYPYYIVLQALEAHPGQAVLTQLASPIHTHYIFLMAVCVGALFLGSMFYSFVVFSKNTLYPRWMALWNIFLITLIVYVLGEVPVFPEMARVILKGIGFHLGLTGHFILTYKFVNKRLFN